MLVSAAALTKMFKFFVKVFKTLYFPNTPMDLVYLWYDYRCWSKILLSTIHNPANDLEVKVTDLEKFYIKVGHGLRNFMLKFCVHFFLDLVYKCKFR